MRSLRWRTADYSIGNEEEKSWFFSLNNLSERFILPSLLGERVASPCLYRPIYLSSRSQSFPCMGKMLNLSLSIDLSFWLLDGWHAAGSSPLVFAGEPRLWGLHIISDRPDDDSSPGADPPVEWHTQNRREAGRQGIHLSRGKQEHAALYRVYCIQ